MESALVWSQDILLVVLNLPQLALDLGLASISPGQTSVVWECSSTLGMQASPWTLCLFFVWLFRLFVCFVFCFCTKFVAVWGKGNSPVDVSYLGEDRFPQLISQLRAPSSNGMLCPHFN